MAATRPDDGVSVGGGLAQQPLEVDAGVEVEARAVRTLHLADDAHVAVAGEVADTPRQSLSSQITAPLVTLSPTTADSPATVPGLCALSGCSIFIASSTTITSPSATS